ncbi:MAG: hypothetical protein HYR85_11650 [Planctomycetes bacterium]|nr:hypothetical protein [Planctomycetota bacterium]MBI3846071.1 hypothetical protein [Planctomycetota bacterium]
MKAEADSLIRSLSHRYVVRQEFITEVQPLVEKIFADQFPERDRDNLVALVEDVFRREAQNFAAFTAGISALEKLKSGMQLHVEALQDLNDKVKTLSHFLTNLKRVSLN